MLSLAALVHREARAVPSIIDEGSTAFVASGRLAIGLALEALGIGEGDNVLIPAYHCLAMVPPIIRLSATPSFYRIGRDLTIDLEDADKKANARTRALIAVHYFGFAQPLELVRAFCRERRIALIEDCAHSFFGTYRGQSLGSFGDFSIGSLPKFFPVSQGGCLNTRSHTDLIRAIPHNASVWMNLKELVRILDSSTYYGRLTALSPLIAAKDLLGDFVKRCLGKRHDSANDDIDGTYVNTAEDVRLASISPMDISTIDVKLVDALSTHRIVDRRRANYHRFARACSNLSGYEVLFSKLPEGAVPYMFPLFVEDLDQKFPFLEDCAVPTQRFGQFLWSGVNERVCETSVWYSRNVIQLPCHQELDTDEIDWMLDVLSLCARRRLNGTRKDTDTRAAIGS